MRLLPDIGYPQTGDNAEVGIYSCMNHTDYENGDDGIAILNTKDKLPECPTCGPTYWMKIS